MWHIALLMAGQIRVAASGAVTGIDMGADLEQAAGLGLDPEIAAELMAQAEAGIVAAYRQVQGRQQEG